MFGHCYTARIFAFYNVFYTVWKFHSNFADYFFVFYYINANIWIHKTQNRKINIDDIVDFYNVFSFSLFARNVHNQRACKTCLIKSKPVKNLRAAACLYVVDYKTIFDCINIKYYRTPRIFAIRAILAYIPYFTCLK